MYHRPSTWVCSPTQFSKLYFRDFSEASSYRHHGLLIRSLSQLKSPKFLIMLGLSANQSPSCSYSDDFPGDNEPTKSCLMTMKDALITQESSRDLGAPRSMPGTGGQRPNIQNTSSLASLLLMRSQVTGELCVRNWWQIT